MKSRKEILQILEDELIQRNDVMGVSVIGDGVNINFVGEMTWWRIEVRDVTMLLKREFEK